MLEKRVKSVRKNYFSKREILKPLYINGFRICSWQGQKDLNPRHAVLETAALPTELYPYIKLVGHQGLEPRTNRL